MERTLQIRLAEPEDFLVLQALEHDAARVFAESPYPDLASQPRRKIADYVMWHALGWIWIAEDADGPLGFIACRPVDATFYIQEISVAHDQQGRGIGRALMNFIVEQAFLGDFVAITLSTFRNVSWNAPFYTGLGFEPLHHKDLTPGLADIFEREKQTGLDMSERTFMMLVL